MTQTTNSTAAPASDREPDLAALQHQALADLLELSRWCAQRQQEILHQHEEARRAADQKLQRALRRIQSRWDRLRRHLRESQQTRLRNIEERFDAQAEHQKTEFQTQRQRLTEQTDAEEHRLRQEYEKALWLADSLCEAQQTAAQQTLRNCQQEDQNLLAQVDQSLEQARQLLGRYRQPLPRIAQESLPLASSEPVSPALLEQHRQIVQVCLEELSRLGLLRWLTGWRPWVVVVATALSVAGLTQLLAAAYAPDLPSLLLWHLVTVGGALAILLLLALTLWALARSRVHALYLPLQRSVWILHQLVRLRQLQAEQDCRQAQAQAQVRRHSEIQAARQHYLPLLQQTRARHLAAMDQLYNRYTTDRQQLEADHQRALETDQTDYTQRSTALDRRYQKSLDQAHQRHAQALARAQQTLDQAQSQLESRWQTGRQRIQSMMAQTAALQNETSYRDWSDSAWAHWQPSCRFRSAVRFGQLRLDTRALASDLSADPRYSLQLPRTFSLPALLGFPRRASLVVHTDLSGRSLALACLQALMLRLLTTLPPGRVRFTILDPVGLGQNFAGFMHLADHDEALVGGRIWTEPDQISQRLADLTQHMENVIQKYLRNEYDDIDQYNAQAGELAEPYRFLVIADFPAGFTDEAAARLASILSSGARCGVYALIARDIRRPLPAGLNLEDLTASCINLLHRNETLLWDDPVYRHFPLTIDAPPHETFVTRLLNLVGRQARLASRVEVPFHVITPPPEKIWSADATDELRLPIGRTGATRLQYFHLGRGVAQHALIAGKTGSGKSTLLHVLITNLALWFSPDQVEFYLIDFKKGVEFKTYAVHSIPHARAVAIESDREFGLSVLRRLDEEMKRRGELFRAAGVQDLPSYRQTVPDAILPRTLLIIDEFQEFFSEDDKLAQDAGLLLDRLVRQGRAFGIHVILGSQTLSGTSGLARSTMGQMAVRIALQCSEADSQLVLADNNTAARLLSRPGEAIYNDAGGLVEANSPFQVAWLPDETREELLARLVQHAQAHGVCRPSAIVFEGNAHAPVTTNAALAQLLNAPGYPPAPASPIIWLGEAVAIKDPTAVVFRRQSGSNLLFVGPRDDAALTMMLLALIALAAQHRPDQIEFWVLDGTPADSPLSGTFARIASLLPHITHLSEYRRVPQTIDQLAQLIAHRAENDTEPHPPLFLFLCGLQRYRVLRRQEEEYSFSLDQPDRPPRPDQQLATILREGPALGVFTVLWADTALALERVFDRQSLRQFDARVLFQMSAADSSNLIDSPIANQLGVFRAVYHSEEQGVLEKFRPYAMPDQVWFQHIRRCFAAKTL